jgi:hypothetical protein
VGLERGPLRLLRINEELLERKVADPVYKTEINDRGGSAATPLYPQKLALNFVDKWQSLIGIVRLRTKGHGVCSAIGGHHGLGDYWDLFQSARAETLVFVTQIQKTEYGLSPAAPDGCLKQFHSFHSFYVALLHEASAVRFLK